MIIYVAGCVIQDEEGRLLLLHRNNGKHVQWEVPGGKIDDGEKPQEAAVREMKEELGVEVVIEKKLGKKEFNQGGHPIQYTWFGARITAGSPRVNEPEVFDQLGYFSIEEIKRMKTLSSSTKNLLKIFG